MAEYNIIKTQFCMDVLPGEYDGFTRGDLWNGWECPIFEKAVAETILKDITSNGYSWKYNPEEDAFLVQHEDDPNDYEPEIFAAEQVVLDNGDVRNLYAIGAYAWIWEKCSE